MALKKTTTINQKDFEAAIIALRLSVSEVSRETKIPRHVVSHFRNYGDGLKPEQAAKLKDWLESKGIEFTNEEKTEPPQTPPSVAALNPQLGVALKVEHHFPISNNITDEVVRKAIYLMEEGDARLMVLLQTKLEHNDGFFGDGEPTEEAKAILQETFSLLAGNYIVFRMLRGWPALDVQATTDNPETVRDMILKTYMRPLVDAGLIVEPQEQEEPADPAEEEETE